MLRHVMTALFMLLGSVSLAENPLDKKVTFFCERITTEKALEHLSLAAGLKIEIQVNELQKEGITKNQSFGIELEDITAKEALLTILLKGDSRGRLAYFINEDGTIIVTTIKAVKLAGMAPPPLAFTC